MFESSVSALCSEDTSQQCPVCEEWIYVTGGPFTDDEWEPKSTAGSDHIKGEHPEVCETKVLENGTVMTSFPLMGKWNTDTVEAWISDEVARQIAKENPQASFLLDKINEKEKT